MKTRQYRNNAPMHDLNELRPLKTQVVNDTHDLTKLEIKGYVSGNATVFKPDLFWKHFDWVQFVHESRNVRTREKFLHFIGFRDSQTVLLIVKEK